MLISFLASLLAAFLRALSFPLISENKHFLSSTLSVLFVYALILNRNISVGHLAFRYQDASVLASFRIDA